MSDTTHAIAGTSSSRRLLPWAAPLAVVIFAVLGGASVWLGFHLHDFAYLAGFVAAVYGAGGVLLWGLSMPAPWPRWSNRVAGSLLLAGATGMAVGGVLAVAGVVSTQGNYLPLSLGLCVASLFPALLFMGAGWVYSDARRRGLNAGLWALLCLVLFPYLLGFVIYVVMVLVRDQRMAVCPRCSARLGGNLAFCTVCGTQLQRTCAQCGAKLPQEAAFCGSCGTAVARS